MPLSDFPELLAKYPLGFEDGFDLTDALGVIKYEGPVDVQIGGDTKGPFPGFIEKTDEERAQNFGQNTIEKMLAEHEFDVTIKVDGSSGTFYLYNGEFGVCSRNQELKDTEGNIFWKMARKYNLEKRMRKVSELTEPHQNFAIQGEVVGPGIQSNRLGLTENKLLVFTIQNIDEAKRLSNDQIEKALEKLSQVWDLEEGEAPPLRMVPRVDTSMVQLKTLADIAALSEGTNLINDKPREGIVLRAKDDPSISMKYINARYLLKFDL
jgi:RNA ligase (TIGR02306 family)